MAKFKDENRNSVIEAFWRAAGKYMIISGSLNTHYARYVMQKPNYDVEVPCVAQWTVVWNSGGCGLGIGVQNSQSKIFPPRFFLC